MKPILLVLAAGMGSRYGGMKQLDHLGPSGETIMDYSVYDAIRAGFGKVVFVIRKSFEKDFRAKVLEKWSGKIETALAFQEMDTLPDGFSCPDKREKPWGTGHAIWVARKEVTGPFAVINADDFYGREAFEIMAEYLSQCTLGNGQYAMCGYQLARTLSEHGKVSRGVCMLGQDEKLQKVTEHTDIGRNSDGLIVSHHSGIILSDNAVVSMNFWGFQKDIFMHLDKKLRLFLTSNIHHARSEFYIPMVVDELISEGEASVEVLRSEARWFGVTYKEDKEVAVASLNNLVMENVYPDNLWSAI